MKTIHCYKHGKVEPHSIIDGDETLFVVCPRCYAKNILQPRLKDYSDELD